MGAPGLRKGTNRANLTIPGFMSWLGMTSRCLNPKATNYPRYGGKGVKVCERWLDFNNFLVDMGPRPEGKTLDRIDNAKGYEPGNCRWATPKEQQRDKRRLLMFRGRLMGRGEIAEELGIDEHTLRWRLQHWGWPEKVTAGA